MSKEFSFLQVLRKLGQTTGMSLLFLIVCLISVGANLPLHFLDGSSIDSVYRTHKSSNQILSKPSVQEKLCVEFRPSSGYAPALVKNLIKFATLFFIFERIQDFTIQSNIISNNVDPTPLSCSYYFLRLNVLKSQSHPPTQHSQVQA